MNFEILIATMFRTNLLFLNNLFSKNDINNFNILVVNQTSEDKLAHSNNPKIRVINSFKRGTSDSRNTAIKNAKGTICLFADDDTVFEKEFGTTIINAFNKHPNADLLTFEAISEEGIPHAKYPSYGLHNKKTLEAVHTIIIAFKPLSILKHSLFFSSFFSLGGIFNGGGEYLFTINALQKKLNLFHIPKTIVYHEEESSGTIMESDANIYARAAMKNHFYGNITAKVWVFKYVFFLLRHNFIKLNEFLSKCKVGFEGVEKYNDLVEKKLISRL